MNVIVVDDDPLILLLMQRQLLRKGHTVQAYQNPIDCPLYWAATSPSKASAIYPDIIITDYDMPEVNGAEFLTQVYAKKHSCTQFAIITGQGIPETDMIRMARLGTRIFLKPIDFSELFVWMDRLDLQTLRAS
ncbi:MAG: response regulator [bacterium]|jgi:DNA-binding response OmpR family regulator